MKLSRKLVAFSCASLLLGCGGGPTEQPTGKETFMCSDHPAMGAKIAEVSAPLDWRECAIRTRESAPGNLIADSLWWALQDNRFSAEVTAAAKAKNVRFAMTNSGAAQLKVLQPAGEICTTGYISKTAPGEGDLSTGKSFADTTLPFANHMVFVTVAPSKLKQILERSFAINETTSPAVDYPNKDGSFLLLSSNVQLEVDFSDYANRAQKVSKPTTTRNGELIVSMTIDGQPVDFTSTEPITFAVSSYVAGIDMANGDIKEGTEPGKGAGVAAGFTSDFFGNDQLPATNEYEILERGKDPKAPTTFTETAAFRKYLEAHPTLDPKVDGRYVYENLTRQLDLCQ